MLKLPSYSHSPRKGCPFGPPGFDGSLKNGAWTFKKRQFPEVAGLSCILIGSCSTSRPSQVLSIVHSIRCSPMFWVENIRNHYGSRPELIKSVAMFRTLYYRWKMWMQIPRPQRQWSYMKMRLYPSQWKFHFRSDVFHSIQIVRSCAISKSIARCLHLNENKELGLSFHPGMLHRRCIEHETTTLSWLAKRRSCVLCSCNEVKQRSSAAMRSCHGPKNSRHAEWQGKNCMRSLWCNRRSLEMTHSDVADSK